MDTVRLQEKLLNSGKSISPQRRNALLIQCNNIKSPKCVIVFIVTNALGPFRGWLGSKTRREKQKSPKTMF
jgi:hypothetical protein